MSQRARGGSLVAVGMKKLRRTCPQNLTHLQKSRVGCVLDGSQVANAALQLSFRNTWRTSRCPALFRCMQRLLGVISGAWKKIFVA